MQKINCYFCLRKGKNLLSQKIKWEPFLNQQTKHKSIYMINNFIRSFKRKIARRVTKKYPTRVESFDVPNIGTFKFAYWENPLAMPQIVDKNIVSYFQKYLKEGDVAIDIGANIGHMAVPMSIAVGKTGTVLAFDPNPYVFEILEQNAKLNPELDNIHPYNCAITEVDDEYYYHSSDASFNNGGISKDKVSRHGKYSLSAKIKGINLESFIQKNYPNISSIKMIKIDTEGYDKEIIKSISNLLNTYKPMVISECFGKSSAADKTEHFELLKSKGYSLFYISDLEMNATIIPIEKKEDMLKWGHFDFYAICE